MSRADETIVCGQPLTPREMQVLLLMTEGYVAKEIGRKLTLSARTVEIYRHRAVYKLGARSGMHAVALAISRGLVPALLG
jgi:DNA-binding NarL/FixJ family response regulator